MPIRGSDKCKGSRKGVNYCIRMGHSPQYVTLLEHASPRPGQLGHYTWLKYNNPETTLGQVLTAHRGPRGPGHRVPTLVTDAVGPTA